MRRCRILYATGSVNRWCDRPRLHEGPCSGMILPVFHVGQRVQITNPLRLAARMLRVSPDGAMRGAGDTVT